MLALDWHEALPESVASGDFALVLAADVLYAPPTFAALAATLAALAARSQALVFTYTPRGDADATFWAEVPEAP